jgi:hypothetical protein
MRFRTSVLLLLALVLVGSVLYLRWRPRPAVDFVAGEREPAPPLPAAAGPSHPPGPVAAPTAAEVQPLLDRVFERTVLMEAGGAPAFVAGDFNGDEVADLAVTVRPRGPDVLARLNGELVIWGMQDARAPHPATVRRPERVGVAATDVLLAVVHGVDPGGWRHPDAVQGYLVKNAATGSALEVRPLAALPGSVRAQAVRPHLGDVIATRRAGELGVVVWTGATYTWASLGGGSAPRGR